MLPTPQSVYFVPEEFIQSLSLTAIKGGDGVRKTRLTSDAKTNGNIRTTGSSQGLTSDSFLNPFPNHQHIDPLIS